MYRMSPYSGALSEGTVLSVFRSRCRIYAVGVSKCLTHLLVQGTYQSSSFDYNAGTNTALPDLGPSPFCGGEPPIAISCLLLLERVALE
jgi:hypothetical protein